MLVLFVKKKKKCNEVTYMNVMMPPRDSDFNFSVNNIELTKNMNNKEEKYWRENRIAWLSQLITINIHLCICV